MPRTSKYNPDYCRQVTYLISRHGFKQHELATMWGVTPTTVRQWRKDHQDFDDAYQRGVDLWDCADIEKSLKKRAKGYKFKEEKIEYEHQLNPITGQYDLVPVKFSIATKDVAPNVQAQKLFLKHRNPERWPNLNKVEVKTDDGLTDILRELGKKLPE